VKNIATIFAACRYAPARFTPSQHIENKAKSSATSDFQSLEIADKNGAHTQSIHDFVNRLLPRFKR
jgi:hypothetical protein